MSCRKAVEKRNVPILQGRRRSALLGERVHACPTSCRVVYNVHVWYTHTAMTRYHLTAVIWKEGKWYVSKCPELGVASYGASPEKARAALAEAVGLYLSNAKRLGLLGNLELALRAETRYTAPLEVVLA